MTGQITIKFAGRDIERCDYSILTERSVETVTARFEFDEEWNGYTKTAVFAGSGTVKKILLDASNICTVPWETLIKPGTLQIGVVGQNGEKILPSVIASVYINKGIYTDGTEPSEPTPNEYEQLITLSEDTKAIAQSVRDDADAGKFKGEKGDTGNKGDTGATGAKIVSTVFVAEDADGGNIYRQTFDNGATAEFTAPKGDKGETGDTGAKGDTGATGATGEAGGYYTPSVDSAGNLSWSASKSGMPGVSGVNIKGEKGDTGDKGEKGDKGDQGIQGIQGEKGDTGNSGTYIGDTEPTDPDVDVWIQPDGDECGLLLPVVTSEDDGKIPMVVDGAWRVSPAPIVSGHRLTDMTYEEFETAVKDPDTYYFVYDPEATQ